MSESSYEELLRHPLWQRKRLEVMQSRGWACEKCGDGEHELHVRHTYYTRGKKPWEYPDGCFQCLCLSCHRLAHGHRRDGTRPDEDSFWGALSRQWGAN